MVFNPVSDDVRFGEGVCNELFFFYNTISNHVGFSSVSYPGGISFVKKSS